MKRPLFLVLPLVSVLFSVIFSITGSLNAAEIPLLDSDDLLIGFVNYEKGLACGSDAEYISGIHEKLNRPLNPSLISSEIKSSNALLGLVVQIRGSINVYGNLLFELNLQFDTTEIVYKGLWESLNSSSSDTVHAHTTDWWINLSKLFSQDDTKSICNDKQRFSVRLLSYEFISN